MPSFARGELDTRVHASYLHRARKQGAATSISTYEDLDQSGRLRGLSLTTPKKSPIRSPALSPDPIHYTSLPRCMRFASKDAEETVERLQNRMRMNRIRHTKFRPGLANSYAKYFFEGIYVPNNPETENFKTCNDMILKSGNYLKVFDKNRRPLDELV